MLISQVSSPWKIIKCRCNSNFSPHGMVATRLQVFMCSVHVSAILWHWKISSAHFKYFQGKIKWMNEAQRKIIALKILLRREALSSCRIHYGMCNTCFFVISIVNVFLKLLMTKTPMQCYSFGNWTLSKSWKSFQLMEI